MNDVTLLGSQTAFTRGENPLRAEKLNQALAERVWRGGDAMQGPLMLARNPVQPEEAATKFYVDTHSGPGTGSGAGSDDPNVIDSLNYDTVADYVELPGTVSWTGTTVTITGAAFDTVKDPGKYLIMPAGGAFAGPVITQITNVVSPTQVHVATTVLAPITGITTVVGGPAAAAWSIDVINPGTGGSLVGDVLTPTAGVAARKATLQVIQTEVLSATVTQAGSLGPAGAVVLRGTTGYGRRVALSGTIDVTGALSGPLTLSADMGADKGAYWYDVDDPNNEPVLAVPRGITLPGHWDTSGTIDSTAITLSTDVSPLVMPAIHTGANVFAVGDDGSVAFPSGTVVLSKSATATTITVLTSHKATHAGTSQQIKFTDNRSDITFSATFANNSTTITATAPVPVGVLPTQLIFGVGITGGDDPTTPLSGTTIVAIDGPRTTLTLSRPTVLTANSPVTMHVVPYLVGAKVKLDLVPAVVAFKDWGAYSTAPNFAAPVGVLVNGAASSITVQQAAGKPMTQPIKVACGTDNTAEINAWLGAIRTRLSTGGQGLEAVLRPGAYLTLGSINARDLNQNAFTMRVSGVSIHSAIDPNPPAGPLSAAAQRAWDASGSRFYRMVGDFTIRGNKDFPPDIGMLFAYSTVNTITSSVTLYDVSATGYFRFASTYMANTEGYITINMDSSNGQAWASANTPCYGKMIDGDNSYGKLDNPALNTHASFLGYTDINGAATCGNGAVPWSIVGCSNLRVTGGYGASWSPPAIFFSRSGHATLNIHCEVGTLTDAMFFWSRPGNNVVTFGNSEFVDTGLNATNSAISYDTGGKFGTPIRAFNAGNASMTVTPSGAGTNLMQVFADHSLFTGGFTWHGNISVSGAAKTASMHWLANMPDDREGVLLLGDDKTNYSGDFIQGGTLLSSGIISAGDDISTTGWVNADDGLRIGPVGQPRANLTYDGTRLSTNVPTSLPALQTSTSYPNDAAAAAGGVPISGLYRNGTAVQIRIT